MRKLYYGLMLISSIAVFSGVAAAQPPTFQNVPRPGLKPAELKEAGGAAELFRSLQTGPGGQVGVLVAIDESGNVSAVESVTGPGNVCPSVVRNDILAIRQAAAQAAQMVRFKPAMVGAVQTASHGWLYFDNGPNPEDAQAEATGNSDETRRFTAIGSPPDYKGPVNNSVSVTPSSDSQAVKVVPPVQENTKQRTNQSLQIQGGVLNGKARSLPKPQYPPAARAVRARGAVTVRVLIDEDGSIFLASAASGHPLLRSASRLAACEAKFGPTMLSGQPVKVAGVITYNFVAP